MFYSNTPIETIDKGLEGIVQVVSGLGSLYKLTPEMIEACGYGDMTEEAIKKLMINNKEDAKELSERFHKYWMKNLESEHDAKFARTEEEYRKRKRKLDEQLLLSREQSNTKARLLEIKESTRIQLEKELKNLKNSSGSLVEELLKEMENLNLEIKESQISSGSQIEELQKELENLKQEKRAEAKKKQDAIDKLNAEVNEMKFMQEWEVVEFNPDELKESLIYSENLGKRSWYSYLAPSWMLSPHELANKDFVAVEAPSAPLKDDDEEADEEADERDYLYDVISMDNMYNNVVQQQFKRNENIKRQNSYKTGNVRKETKRGIET